MNESRPAPAFASVIYVRLAQFGGKPVAEQARLRTQLEAIVEAALGGLAPQDRLVLDAVDGLIVVALGDPAGALEAAQKCLQGEAGLALCIGANHGPIARSVESDVLDGLVGDGIQAAAIAAGFAQPGQMLATRPFRERLAQYAPARVAELQAAGTFSDASVRTHELYAAVPDARARRRRRLLILGGVGVTVMLVLAAFLRSVLPEGGLFAPPAILVFDISPGGQVFVDGEARGAVPPLAQIELRAGAHAVEVRHGALPPYRATLQLKPGEQVLVKHAFVLPAILAFEVTPGGDVYIDGKHMGAIPALRELELPAGAHNVEIRYGKFAPLKLGLTLRPEQYYVVKHRFQKRTPTWTERVKDVFGIDK